jgi:hypothetical protein
MPLPAIAHQLGHQLVCARQAADEAQRLDFGQNGGQSLGWRSGRSPALPSAQRPTERLQRIRHSPLPQGDISGEMGDISILG